MNILKFLLLAILFISPSAFADVQFTVENQATTDTLNNVTSPIKTGSTSTSFTRSTSLKNQAIASVGVMYKASSPGVINLSIQAQRSYDRPATESSDSTNYVVWNGPFTTTDDQWHMATLDTVVMPYLRFKIVGTGSNDASTTLQIKVVKQ